MEQEGRKRRRLSSKKKNDIIANKLVIRQLYVLKNETNKLSRKIEKLRNYNIKLLSILNEFLSNKIIYDMYYQSDNLFV